MGFLSGSGIASPGAGPGDSGGFGLVGQLMAQIAAAEKQKAGPTAAAKVAPAGAPPQQQQAAPDSVIELQALNDELVSQYGTNVDAMRKDPRYARVAQLAEAHKSQLPKINQAAWDQMAAGGR
ncbi:MAG: hypothetical protein EBR18_09230 [Betaproteobacteria bacterium]|nr:hypothetical protein [Betaproteobacteria bacterium]